MNTININYSFNGILYAPVFLADALGFFPKNTRLVYRSGDAATIDALCLHNSDGEKNWFAICDPFSVDISKKVPEHTDDELCIVGGLIDHLPIWVYNTDPDILPVDSEKSLGDYAEKVRRLVCYKEGTTGHLIARRLQKLFSLKADGVNYVNFGEEFRSPLDPGTVLVTSDALRMVHFGRTRQGVIIYNYRMRPPLDLEPFLFTAVVTLKKEVIDRNLWAVLAILAGLKNAIELLRQENIPSECVELLMAHYSTDMDDLGLVDVADRRRLIRDAIAYIFRTEEVYAEDLRPGKKAWDNAKGQWEELLNKKHPGIEERNDPIPSLLIKRDWRKDHELRTYITRGVPSIGSFAESPQLKLHHKLTIPVTLMVDLVSLYMLLAAFVGSKLSFKENFPGICFMTLAFVILALFSFTLVRDLMRGSLKHYETYVVVGIATTLGTIIGAIGLIR